MHPKNARVGYGVINAAEARVRGATEKKRRYVYFWKKMSWRHQRMEMFAVSNQLNFKRHRSMCDELSTATRPKDLSVY